MPKQIEIGCLYDNFEITKEAPSTYDEVDTLVGEVGGALDGFIADCTARNFLPRLYKDVSQQIESLGHPRKQTGSTKKADGTERPIMETHIAHIGRVHDEGDAALKADIGKRLQETASKLPFFAKGERTGGGGKISQGALDAANGFFAESDEKVEAVIGVIESTVPGYKVARDADNNATPESLARGIQALNKHLENMAKKNALSALQNATA